MICSRFLMRSSAARRAERGPSPGRRASSWIRRSISGPATAAWAWLRTASCRAAAAGRRRRSSSSPAAALRPCGARRRARRRSDPRRFPSPGFISDSSIVTPFISPLPESLTATRPPPDAPSTSIWSSSACIASILDLSSAACFIRPRKSAIVTSLSASSSHRSAPSERRPRAAFRRHRLGRAAIAAGCAVGAAHIDDLAPGKRASTACTSGSARTPVFSSACRASCCDLRSAAPCSAETTTIQRRPVHCESLRERSLTSVLAALGSSAMSSRPSSQRTSRTSRSSAALTPRSRFCAASAISPSKLRPPAPAGQLPSGGAATGRRLR